MLCICNERASSYIVVFQVLKSKANSTILEIKRLKMRNTKIKSKNRTLF